MRLLLSYLLLIAISPTSLSAQRIADIADEVGKSVVMIVAYDATGTARAQGSGVFATGDGRILTNAHVVDDAYSAEVLSDIGNFESVRVLYTDTNLDLAIIKIETDQSVPPIFSEESEFRAGQRVIAIGNPLGLERTVSDGLISGIRRTEDGIELIQTTVPISPGSSGGVLLNEEGHVIGITTSTFKEGQNINFAISINTITRFADEYVQADPKRANYKQLQLAKTTVWYSVLFSWILGILVFILRFAFGDAFYLGLPILFIAGYLVYGLARGIWWVVSYPFRLSKRVFEQSNKTKTFPNHEQRDSIEPSVHGDTLDEPPEKQLEDVSNSVIFASGLANLGPDCDTLPGSYGDFGKSTTNPIPVNGNIGETTYINNLRSRSGVGFFYHRQSSASSPVSENPIDIFELIAIDGSQSAVLFFSMYHPRRSSKTPNGFSRRSWNSLDEDERVLCKLDGFGITSGSVDNFPWDLPEAIERSGSLSDFSPGLASTLANRVRYRLKTNREQIQQAKAQIANLHNPTRERKKRIEVPTLNKDGTIGGYVSASPDDMRFTIHAGEKADFNAALMSAIGPMSAHAPRGVQIFFSRWAGLPEDSWREEHIYLFSITFIHFLQHARKQGKKLPKALQDLLKHIPMNPISALPNAITEDICDMYQNIFDEGSPRIPFCDNCGSKNEPNSKFCSECGQAFTRRIQ